MDFLSTHECKVNLADQHLTIHGMEVTLWQEGSRPQCCQITIKEDIVVPAESEMIIGGMAQQRGSEAKLNIVEHTTKFVENYGLLVGRSLVDIRRGVIPLRVLNPHSQSIKLFQGTVVGVAEPVEICHNAPVEIEKVLVRHVARETNHNLPNEETAPPEPHSQRDNASRGVPAHLQELLENGSQFLTSEQKQSLEQLLVKFQEVFVGPDGKLGRTNLIKHKINTGDHRPIRQHPRRVPLHLQEEAKGQVKKMLQEGVIEPSSSPWSAPVVLVRKKDGTYRYCIDYRMLNKVTVGDAYPIPRVSFDQLEGAKWFGTLDLQSGYWQVEMDQADKEKTAFVCKEGLFQFNLMPFGLTNAPSTFERLMEMVLAGLQYQICLIYLDDVIVYGKSFEEEISRLGKVFCRLQDAGLKLKPQKCVLFQKQVTYLGHIVSERGVAPDPAKIESVKGWPTPTNVTEVRSFLGLAAYYRRFIKDFSRIASPLHRLTEKGRMFSWDETCQAAFEELKVHLTLAPVLAYPKLETKFILDTDASDVAIGAVLSQKFDEREHVIAYGSRCLSKAERRYCVTRKELLAIVYFVKYFRHYLYGRQFLLRTDHGSLRWLFNFKEPEGQVARWIEALSTFDFDIQHRPGRQHGNADGLSRIPCRQCGEHQAAMIQTIAHKDNTVPTRKVMTTAETESWVSGWSQNLIREKQLNDPDIGKILKLKESSQRKPCWQDVSSDNEVVKAYWFLWSQLYVRDGVLYKLWEEETSPMGHWQLVAPTELRKEILEMLHDHVTAAHLGQHKTLARVWRRFFWYKLKEDVNKWCNNCETCAKKKMPIPTNKAQMQSYTVGCPMERVALDILGPLPRTSRGNVYILVVADYFTRWTEAYLMRNQEAVTVAKKLVNEFICHFGAPLQVLTDQGAQFESQLFCEMCHLLDISKTRTSAYHPQSDGMVERFNRTLASMLSLFGKDHQRDWDVHVPMVMMAYRSTIQETTSVSPNKMMMGREVNMPIDLLFGGPLEVKEATYGSEYVAELQDKLKLGHEWARIHLKKGAERQKKMYDLKATSQGYKRGQFVWVYTPCKKKGLSPKLQKYWDGPFLVINKLSDALYRVQRSARSACKIIHFNRLKLADGQERIPWIPEVEPEVLLEQGNLEGDSSAGERRIQLVDSDTETDEEADNTKKQEVMVAEKGPQDQPEGCVDHLDVQGSEEPDEGQSTRVTPRGSCRRSERISRPPRRLIEEI